MLCLSFAGLFRGAISESGSTLCPWAFQRHPLSWAITFGEQLGCSYNNDTAALTACVFGKSADELVEATNALDVCGSTLGRTLRFLQTIISCHFSGVQRYDTPICARR